MLSRLSAGQHVASRDSSGLSEINQREVGVIDRPALTLEQVMHDLRQGELFPAHTGFTNAFIMTEMLGAISE